MGKSDDPNADAQDKLSAYKGRQATADQTGGFLDGIRALRAATKAGRAITKADKANAKKKSK
jgi:hypothetical protein